MEHPEIVSDLWALYQFNVYDAIESGDMRLLWVLINRLSYEAKSLWRAKTLAETPRVKGTKQERDYTSEWFGWDSTSNILASVYDKLDVLLDAVVKHGSKKQIKLSNPYQRPGSVDRRIANSLDDVLNFFGTDAM